MDALDNLVANVHQLRTDGGVRLAHPMGLPILIPTPIVPVDLKVLLVLMSEGWLIAAEPRDEPEPHPASPLTTALQRRSTTSRRRKRRVG